LICLLPVSWAIGLGRVFGLVWYYLIPVRRHVALVNVGRVFGDSLSPAQRRRMVRDNFVHLATYAVELLRIPQMTPESAADLASIEGWEHIEQGFARGKGVIVVASHVGNVDLAGTSMAIRGVPVSVVAKDMGAMTRSFVAAVRARTGVILIPPRRSKEQIKELLAANKMVVLIIDQHVAKHRAVVCDFFGQRAATSPAPARFAAETGAALIPGVTYRLPGSHRHVLRFLPPFTLEHPHADADDNLQHNTERLNRLVEAWVRERPEQWMWVHKRWKVHDDPESWERASAARSVAKAG
jgi:KDO2-lipid IV(A) lauroyltransferase